MTDGNMNEGAGVRTAQAQPGSGAASGWDALPEHIKAHEREITLRYIIREILATPHNPGRWEQWAKTELKKLGPLREAHPNS